MTWLQGFIWFQQEFIFSWYPEVRRLFVEISPVYNKFTVIVKGNLRERVPPTVPLAKKYVNTAHSKSIGVRIYVPLCAILHLCVQLIAAAHCKDTGERMCDPVPIKHSRLKIWLQSVHQQLLTKLAMLSSRTENIYNLLPCIHNYFSLTKDIRIKEVSLWFY